MIHPRTISRLGDRRERAVPCRTCRQPCWTLDATCPRCTPSDADMEVQRWHDSAHLVTVDDAMRRDAMRDSIIPRHLH